MATCEKSPMCMADICVNLHTEAQNSEYYRYHALLHDQYWGSLHDFELFFVGRTF